MDHDSLSTSLATANAELAQVRKTTQLVAIEPDFSEIDVTAEMMMDPAVAAQAVGIGRRQAGRDAAARSAVWRI